MFISMFQGLHMFRTLLVLLVVSAVLFGCGKSGNVRWVHYDETYCADKWEKSVNNEKLKSNISSYLEGKGIKVFEIEIFTDRSAETCTDCACKSGRRVKVKIKRSDVKEIKREGFYE